MQDLPEQSPWQNAVSTETRRNGPAWENRKEMGLLKGLLTTLRLSLFRPRRFFSEMRQTGGFFDPLVYAMAVGSFSIVMSIVWELVLVPEGSSFLEMTAAGDLLRLRSMIYGLTVILSPIIVTILVLVAAAILHLGLLVFGGGERGFEASFRVVCYAQGAGVWNVVPFLGGVLELVWKLVLLVTGLTEAHETAAWRSVMAVLAIAVLWMAAALGLALTLMGGGLF
jgi:hypothetical protein